MPLEKSCSCFNKREHNAIRCPENPNRDRRCPNWAKMGHGPETCFSRPKAALRVKDEKDVQQNQVIYMDGGEHSSSSEEQSSSTDEQDEQGGLNVILDEDAAAGHILAVK